jgi:hypothetical protein
VPSHANAKSSSGIELIGAIVTVLHFVPTGTVFFLVIWISPDELTFGAEVCAWSQKTFNNDNPVLGLS